MRNPVTMLREQLSPQQDAKAGREMTDVEKEQLAKVKGELEHQHRGWLEHPITIESVKRLERDLINSEDNIARLMVNPQVSDSFLRGVVMQWLTLKVTLNSIKTTQLILS